MYRDVEILVAEDSEDDALLLRRAFLKAGVNVRIEVVDDGEMAVRYLDGAEPFEVRRSFPLPKLMLLDLKMPRQDGFSVLNWLRDQDGLRRLPLIVLSASEEPKDVDLAHELGANGYARKPVSFDRLVEMVRDIEAFWLKQHVFPRLETA
jgi:CheY-like chemotaxis protein